MYQVHKSIGVRRSRFTNGSWRRERGFSQTTDTRRQDTRCVGHESSHCFQSVRSRQDLSCCSECADDQKTRLVVGTNKDLALLRVRGEAQRNTTREVTVDEERHEYRTAHVRGMTSTPQCAM